jgi:hypothetical protein
MYPPMSFESAVLHFCCRLFIYIRVTVPPELISQ